MQTNNKSKLGEEKPDFEKLVKEADEQISLQLEELKSLDKLKKDFGGMISHEFLTPLVPILGYCKILTDPDKFGPITQHQLRAVHIIYKNAKKLEDQIRTLLDIQKLEINGMIIKKRDFESKEIILDILDDFANSLKDKNVKMEMSLKSLIIHASITRFRQIFSNLLNNALEFIPQENGLIEIGMEDQDDKVLFYVKDNGAGIPKEEQKDLFKKFYQSDYSHARKHGGMGLGLALCKGLVDAQGGKIWCKSEVGKGTGFYFTLPKKNNDSS